LIEEVDQQITEIAEKRSKFYIQVDGELFLTSDDYFRIFWNTP